MPPTIPRRGLRVCRASSSPRGTKISTFSLRGSPGQSSSHTWRRAPRIILRGTGLMAGSPTATGRPGLVTRPTPSPPARAISSAGPRGFQAPDPGPDLRPIGDVRVIAGILDHHRLAPNAVLFVPVEGNAQAAATGQGHLHPLRAGPAQQFVQRPLGRSRRGGAGGKPLAQFLPGPGRPEGLVVVRDRDGYGCLFHLRFTAVLLGLSYLFRVAGHQYPLPCFLMMIMER